MTITNIELFLMLANAAFAGGALAIAVCMWTGGASVKGPLALAALNIFAIVFAFPY